MGVILFLLITAGFIALAIKRKTKDSRFIFYMLLMHFCVYCYTFVFMDIDNNPVLYSILLFLSTISIFVFVKHAFPYGQSSILALGFSLFLLITITILFGRYYYLVNLIEHDYAVRLYAISSTDPFVIYWAKHSAIYFEFALKHYSFSLEALSSDNPYSFQTVCGIFFSAVIFAELASRIKKCLFQSHNRQEYRE